MLPLSIDKSKAFGNNSFGEKRNLYGKMPKYCAAPNGAPLTNVRSLNEKHVLYAKRLNHCVEPTKVPFTHVKSAGIPTWKQTCVLATLLFLSGAAAGIAVSSSQKDGAPPPPPPPLPPPSPFTVLPPQSPPIYGCTDSTQLGYLADATFDDGSCIQPIYGCVHSLALNFDATANVDDGSCEFTSVHGTIALFGYLQNCRVVVDGFGDGFSQAAELGPEDPWARSNNLGHYTVHYLDEGLVGVQPAMPAAGFPCTDSITQYPLEVPLRTGQNASMATLLTTVAIDIRQTRQAECIAQGHGGSSLATCLSVGGKDIDTYLADKVCRNLVPPVPCSFSSQPCNVATDYVDSCVLDGEPISVWHFDALRQYISDSTRDPAWFAWMVAQINTAFTVGCAKTSLMCASSQLCGDCEATCASQGIATGNHSASYVGTSVFSALAQIVEEGPAELEDPNGAGVLRLINKSAIALGVQPIHPQAIVQECASKNYETYQALLTSPLPASPSFAGAASVAKVCGKIQPDGGSCQARLSLVLERLQLLRGSEVAAAAAAAASKTQAR